MVGGDIVEQMGGIQLLNQGSARWCANLENLKNLYCTFENFFREDIARALSIDRDQVDVLFVKSSGIDSIVVTFRFIPFDLSSIESAEYHDSNWLDEKVSELIEQVRL